MKISIIIVTYNSAKWIGNCLRSVFLSDSNVHLKVNVSVIDNASNDNSADIVEKYFPEAELIRLKENTGFVGANNIGIKRAMDKGCDYVFLLNPDTEIEPNCLEEIIKAAQKENAGIAQSMLLLGKERRLTNNAGNAMHYLGFGFVKHYRESAEKWLDKEPFEIGYASGAAMLIKREALSVITREHTRDRQPAGRHGGNPVFSAIDTGLRRRPGYRAPRNDMFYFDPKFFAYHEDLDLCWRARLAGYKVILAPKSIVYHYYEFNRNKKMFYWAERNRSIAILQNYSIKTLLILSPMLFLIGLMMLAYSATTGRLNYKIKSCIWILSRWPSILKQRKHVQSTRRVSDREIIKHMDSELKFSEVNNPVLKYIASPISVLYFKIVKILI